jgi:hypothetical protein
VNSGYNLPQPPGLESGVDNTPVLKLSFKLTITTMSLFAKYAATHKPAQSKETVHAILLAWNPTKSVSTKQGDKEQIIVTVQHGDNVCDMWLFRDSVSGLPNYVPQGGVPCMLTLREVSDPNDKTKTYVNAIAMGVAA